jgi:CheY-like chemotaxis protein
MDINNFELNITLLAPELITTLNKHKELSERIRAFLQTERSYPTEDPLRHSMQALIKILKTLRGNISISRKHDIELRIPLERKEPALVNGFAKKPSPARMLIIEHQTILQIAIKRMLQADYAALNLDFVMDGEAGIQKHLEQEYDLLLIDLHLPNTDPFALIQTLTNSKSIPILVVASKFSEEDLSRLHTLGVKVHLSKPLLREALIAAISEVLKN